MSNTAIHYLYRDGSNNKQGAVAVLAGELSLDQMKVVVGRLDEPDLEGLQEGAPLGLLIPGQVGLRDLQGDFQGGQATWIEEDHPWHELEAIEPTEAPPTQEMRVEAFLSLVCGVTWDDAYVPPLKAASLAAQPQP